MLSPSPTTPGRPSRTTHPGCGLPRPPQSHPGRRHRSAAASVDARVRCARIDGSGVVTLRYHGRVCITSASGEPTPEPTNSCSWSTTATSASSTPPRASCCARRPPSRVAQRPPRHSQPLRNPKRLVGHPGVCTGPTIVTWGHWPTQAEQDAAASGRTGGTSGLDDWASCEINCDVKVDATGGLTAHVTARLRHDDERSAPVRYNLQLLMRHPSEFRLRFLWISFQDPISRPSQATTHEPIHGFKFTVCVLNKNDRPHVSYLRHPKWTFQ